MFSKNICLKVSVITLLEFELAYYDAAVENVNPWATVNSLDDWMNLMAAKIEKLKKESRWKMKKWSEGKKERE